MKTKHIIYCIFCVLMFAACSGGDYERQLERFEEMNRTDVPLCVDSLQPLVRHYDHWWHSRNHRMRAYYMLGCAYRDQGEAPAAIHYYNIAAEQADTASSECDYATLFRVYGQMAIIYGQQNMPQEKKEALTKYGYYAWMACDTINHIVAYEQMTDVCYMLDDTTGVFAYTDSANMLYRKYGFGELSARVYPTAIYVCLNNNDLQRARKYMDIFEKESGLFDKNGNIEAGREHYYYSKGLYYEKSGNFDSAEYYYRKLIPHGYLYEASKGLLSIYKEQNERDSIVKYVELTEHALGQWAGSQQTNAVIQSSAMYKYERNQNAAIRNADRASRLTKLLVIAVMLIVLLSVLYLYRNERRKREISELMEANLKGQVEIQQMYERLRLMQEEYDQLKRKNTDETDGFESNAQQRTKDLEAEIGQLRSQIASYQEKARLREKHLKESEAVVRFHALADNRTFPQLPTGKDWNNLIIMYKRLMPYLLVRLQSAGLSQQELRTVLLTHLGFPTNDIALLLNTTSPAISKAKSKANKKLFSSEQTANLAENLKEWG